VAGLVGWGSHQSGGCLRVSPALLDTFQAERSNLQILCVDCRRQWRIACPECANEKADKHRDRHPEHKVTVSGVDETAGRPYEAPRIVDFPSWMRGKHFLG
jgi:hypothetical protein